MNKHSLTLALLMIGISAEAQAQTVVTTMPGQPVVVAAPPQPYCREYTQTLKIGDTLQKAYGTACRQPDGSWELIPATAQTGAAPPANITYVVREDHVYYVPSPPVAEVIVGGYAHGHRRHW